MKEQLKEGDARKTEMASEMVKEYLQQHSDIISKEKIEAESFVEQSSV